jgi:hypothetical protein
MEELERFEFELCECEFGPHVETVKTSDGSWVRFEDVAALLEDRVLVDPVSLLRLFRKEVS